MRITVATLLFGISLLLLGAGMLSTVIALHAGLAGFKASVIGVIMSAYFLGYVAGTFVCPALIRRVGHIRAFAAMAAVAAACTAGFGLLAHPLVWILLRGLMGLCFVGVYMVVESWLNEQAPSHQRGKVFAAYMATTLLALALGQGLVVPLQVGTLEPYAVGAALLALGLVPIAVTRVSEPVPISAPALHPIQLYRISPLGFVGSGIAGLTAGMFWGLGPLFAQRVGLTEPGIAAFMAATIVGGALLQWPIGHLSDNRDRRTVLMAVSFSAAAVALVAEAVIGASVALLSLCAFAYGGLMFSAYGLSVAHTNDYLSAPQVLEATSGLLLIYGLGAMLGPLLAGPLMQGFGPASLPGLSAVCFAGLGGFALYRMSKRPAPPLEAQAAYVPMTRTSQAALELYPEAQVEPELELGPPAEEGESKTGA